MIKKINKNQNRKRKHARIRRKISGTSERPRVSVYRSNKHIYAQLIDDINGNTLVSASTLDTDFSFDEKNAGTIEASKEVGKLLGEKATDAGIQEAVFDRSGYVYKGRIAALAEGAREAGLKI